ncbi:MAG TPA: heavy-metal-associated domain-containing protein [Chloroflexaceae bacterium]|nr:heavy-metal-associated domain-containing protein [Chloroflexaceae bacterium]
MATQRMTVPIYNLSCAGGGALVVERTLARTPGVARVYVNPATEMAYVEYDPETTTAQAVADAVTVAGFGPPPVKPAPAPRATAPERTPSPRSAALTWRPLAAALLAVAGLLVFYLGVISLAQGWAHATQQLAEDRWFIGAISLGFGAQVGLFVYLRALHARAAAGGVAASTGTSTAAMLACCAHHLADVLPIVGLSGAALLLNAYKTPLLWLGIVMNLGGALYLLHKVDQARRMHCHTA